jgi:hypothetical protein
MMRSFPGRPGLLPAAFLLPVVLLPVVAGANCGLQSCPRPAHEADASVLQADLRTRWVTFDAAGVSGSYAVLAPRLLWRPLTRWTVGAEVPVTRLESQGEVHTGLSNPLLTALYARRLSHVWSGEAGLQLELPFGQTEHGLADDHTMILPWIGLRRDIGAEGAWQASGLLGFSQALEFGESGDTDATELAKTAALAKTAKSAHSGVDHGDGGGVLVNPHGDRELQWRAGLARLFGRSTAEAFALGQTDVSDGAAHAVHYVRAGASFEYTLTRALGLQILAHAPVTSARRSDAEIGAGIRLGW